MIVALLKYSIKVSSVTSNFCNVKLKCFQFVKQLTQFLRNTGHSQLPYTFSTLIHIHLPLNGKGLSCFRFVPKMDSFKTRPLEFSQKNFPPLRKIFWRTKSNKSNQINSGALVNAETVRQNSLSNTDSGSMRCSYRDVVANTKVINSKGRNLRKIVSDIRQDVYTPYGKWIKDGWIDERAKNGTFIKVVSYNILAQSLLHAHPELYRECNKSYLTWGYRSFLLINELNRFNADILCLQEVEFEQLDFFNTQLGEFGYKGIFKQRTNEKEDGCAIYYKTDKFNLRECVSVEYYQPNINLLNRDNIGIVLRLSPKENENQCVVVATTHLLFNPKRHDIKLAQMQMLLAEIDRVAFKSVNESNEPTYHPVILTGDFNLQPYTLVYNLLVNGTVDNISQCYQPNYRLRSPNKPLIPVRLGITDGCQHYHVAKNRRLDRTEISDFQYVKLFNTDRKSLKIADDNLSWRHNSAFEYDRFGSDSLYHNLNLASAYPHADDCARDATTYQDEWCTVDYIFYGPMQKIDNAETNKVDGEIKLVSYLKLPDCDQATCLGRLPNEVCPSDHLPLSATFHLPIINVEKPSEKCKF